MNPGGAFVALYLAVNIVAFALFGIDKIHARHGLPRLRESTLLNWALCGGALGALIGQQWFRHKTRKQPFRTLLLVTACLNLAALGWVAFPYVWAGLGPSSKGL